MNMRTRLIAVLVALAAVAVFTTDASAMYHAGMGVFMQRDPGAGGANRVGSGGAPAATGRFIPRDPTGSNQYANGMNLYQYVRSNPAAFVDPSGLGTWMPGGGYAPIWGEPGTREPDTSDGPLGMADAYYNWGRSIDEGTYDESTKLVKEVKASQAYASYKALYMESPAETAGLEWSKLVGDVETCETLPGMAVRNGGWVATTDSASRLGFGQNRAWWWQKHLVGFTGYYLGGMLGRSYINATMSCEFCQKCVKGRWEISGDCTANLSIHDTWDVGGNPGDNWAENVAGALGKPIQMHLYWKDAFTVKRSRKPTP